MEKFASYSSEASTPSASGQAPKAAEGQSQAHAPATPAPLSSSAVQGKFGPAVRKLLAESGLDASQLTGTGPHGMLVKGDVLAAMKSGLLPKSKSTPAAASKTSAPAKVPAASSPALSYEDIPTSQIRKVCMALMNQQLKSQSIGSFLEYNLHTCLQMVKYLQLILNGNPWINCFSDHSKATGGIQVWHTTCLS